MSQNQPPRPPYGYYPPTASPPPPPRLPTLPVAVTKGFPTWLALTLAAVTGIGGCTVGMGIGAAGSSSTLSSPADPQPSRTSTTDPSLAPKKPAAQPTQTATKPAAKPEPPTKPQPAPRPAATSLSKRGWAKVAKDPDAYKGRRIRIYGEVTQFDSITGTNAFRADIAHANTTEYGWFRGENSMLTGSAQQLEDVVKDDVFRASVTVLGAYEYNTMLGGGTRVPHLQIDSIKVVGKNR
jgi:hypothetical protein